MLSSVKEEKGKKGLRRVSPAEINLKAQKHHRASFLSQEIVDVRRVSQKYQRSNVGQFFDLIRPVVILGNCLGVMPLKNFMAGDVMKIKFSWKSGIFVYSLVIQCLIFVLVATSFYKQFSTGIEFGKFQNLIYYTVSFLTYVNFVVLASKWRDLIFCWEINEWLLLQEIDENYNTKQLKRKAHAILCGSFAIGSILQSLWQLTLYTETTECDGFGSRTHAFFSNSFPELFAIVPYSQPVAICAQLTSLLVEFSHIYLNVFLIIVCLALREQFAILNRRVLRTPLNLMNESFWQQKWCVYKRIVNLLYNVNSCLDFFLLLSYGSNLFDICVQLMFSMRSKSSAAQGLYAWLSLFYLIARVFCLSIIASQVHEESKRLIPFIRNLPTSLWNIEVERFLEHLTTEQLALSGMQFFTITKSLILKIVGTVVTYELVMLKFKEADEEKHVDKNPCL